ncbi:hypothetical protein GCM10025879_10530 [Leuconostoc litchii]|uniref:hypothetical protein n=1 Tax=Leuconostoc litchii TaxID=1981069 RepID=UPI0023E93AB2|nr:hypothetical protein [Leuconostoc litchii]GMA69807.1 hypothetical protein GCM10025879_10530 [Leuconostoc litchii]
MVNTKKEIFTNHYNHVPVSFWYHFSASSGVDLDAFQDPEIIDRTIAGTKKLVDTISPDFVKLMSDGLFHYKFRKKNTSNTRTVYDNLLPITDDNPWLIKTAELIRKQKKLLENVRLFTIFFHPQPCLNGR